MAGGIQGAGVFNNPRVTSKSLVGLSCGRLLRCEEVALQLLFEMIAHQSVST